MDDLAGASLQEHQDAPQKIDDTARRILNLLFILNTAVAPLTTEQIVSDQDLGYGSGNRDSDKKKFKRDREKLLAQGVVIAEVRAPGAAETEESSWVIDRARTHAATGLLSHDDALLLMDALDEHLARADIPYRLPLARIRDKAVAAAAAAAPGAKPWEHDNRFLAAAPSSPQDAVLEAVWTAFGLRKRLTFLYADARGAETKRSVAIYGLFSLEGHSYFVGLDDRSNTIRTFRADRIVRAWRPKDSYRIPDDFAISPYLFLPFDLAPGDGTQVTFTFPATAPEAELATITQGRGTLERDAAGAWRWEILVRSLDSAASFALQHAAAGMRPAAPQALVDAWRACIERTVAAHA